MKLELLLLILLLVLLMLCLLNNNQKSVFMDIDRICLRAGYNTPRYRVHVTRSLGETHTVFEMIPIIYLRTHKDNGEAFSRETIISVLLHEIAHILCPSSGHTQEFDDIENLLLDSAVELGYLTTNFKIEEGYPCRM